MSGAMFPSYNSGKVIGEINWLEPITIVPINQPMSIPQAISDNIVIPINRKDLNEFYFGFALKSSTKSSEVATTINDLLFINSSEQNYENENTVCFLRKMNIGKAMSFYKKGSTIDRMLLKLVSEDEGKFVIQISAISSISGSYYLSSTFLIGWR